MKCKNCGHEAPHEDFMYPERGSTMLDCSYYYKCPKCKTMIAPYGLDLSGKPIPLMDGFRCPFCEISLEKKEMQFHVGIPLCMELRKSHLKTVSIKTLLRGHPLVVKQLDYDYFGKAGCKRVTAYMFDRSTFGHPDKGKPIKLEEFVDHSED